MGWSLRVDSIKEGLIAAYPFPLCGRGSHDPWLGSRSVHSDELAPNHARSKQNPRAKSLISEVSSRGLLLNLDLSRIKWIIGKEIEDGTKRNSLSFLLAS